MEQRHWKHPRSEATAADDDEDDDDAEDDDEEPSANVLMELDPPRGKSTASRISHSQEDTSAIPRSDTVADLLRAFLRRFRIVVSLEVKYPYLFEAQDME